MNLFETFRITGKIKAFAELALIETYELNNALKNDEKLRKILSSDARKQKIKYFGRVEKLLFEISTILKETRWLG